MGGLSAVAEHAVAQQGVDVQSDDGVGDVSFLRLLVCRTLVILYGLLFPIVVLLALVLAVCSRFDVAKVWGAVTNSYVRLWNGLPPGSTPSASDAQIAGASPTPPDTAQQCEAPQTSGAQNSPLPPLLDQLPGEALDGESKDYATVAANLHVNRADLERHSELDYGGSYQISDALNASGLATTENGRRTVSAKYLFQASTLVPSLTIEIAELRNRAARIEISIVHEYNAMLSKISVFTDEEIEYVKQLWEVKTILTAIREYCFTMPLNQIADNIIAALSKWHNARVTAIRSDSPADIQSANVMWQRAIAIIFPPRIEVV
ncbi:MAG: hypothetical protein LBB38_02140 [Puniceicoccales bacterium]|jgi:hypothetical protein|nr:hypothetical protein [Puniceicoccales bacterium]